MSPRDELLKRSNSISEEGILKSNSDKKPRKARENSFDLSPLVREISNDLSSSLDSREVLSLMEQSCFPFSAVEGRHEQPQSELIGISMFVSKINRFKIFKTFCIIIYSVYSKELSTVK